MKSWKVYHFTPTLWEPNFLDEHTNVAVCVCIFIQDNMHCININMVIYCNEKDIEICAVKLHILFCTICLQISTGNTAYFLNNLDAALNQIV